MNKVKFAVIGVGGFGGTHASAICSHELAELVCICDVRLDVAMMRADAFGCIYYTDYREMLSDGGFDCVVIATPDQTHREIAVAALEANYHVICEKPLALTREDCQAIIDAERKSGKKCLVGQSCRKNQSFLKMKELIDSGELGNIYHFEIDYSHYYGFLKPAWRRDGERLRYPIIGGGCHAIDVIRWLLGEPEEIFAISTVGSLCDWPVDDCTIAMIRMKNGAIGRISCDIGIQKEYSMETEICGTRAVADCDPRRGTITIHKIECEDGRASARQTRVVIEQTCGLHHVGAEVDEMCRAILYGEPISCTAIEGANTVAVGLAAVESAKNNGTSVKPVYFE